MSELRIKVIEPEVEVYTFDPIDTEPHCKIEDIRNFVQRKFPSYRNEDMSFVTVNIHVKIAGKRLQMFAGEEERKQL